MKGARTARGLGRLLGIAALAALLPVRAGAALWVAQRTWSEAEEARFGRWVEANVREDFFLHPPIPQDCADVPYALRWIYARERRLPVAATSVDGELIGHWSARFGPVTKGDWRHDKNFRAALAYVLSVTSTKTLPLDTYPVAIDRDHLQAGVVYHGEHHAAVVARVVLDGSEPHPLVTWESTLPAAVRPLREGIFSGSAPEAKGYGLRRFRWLEETRAGWRYVPLERQSGYSEEQFQVAFVQGKTSFAEAVADRLAPQPAPPTVQALSFVEQADRLARERVPIVLTGHRACAPVPARCGEGSPLWELYSTPNRDARMLGYLSRVSDLVDSGRVDRDWLRQLLRAHSLDLGAPVRPGAGQDTRISLLDLYENAPYVSSEPGDSLAKRWGLAPCDSIRDRAEAIQASIAYLRQDAALDDYTRRAIELRERELADLAVEPRGRGCAPPLPPEASAQRAPQSTETAGKS